MEVRTQVVQEYLSHETQLGATDEVQYLYKPPLLDSIITGIRKLSFIPQNNHNKQLVKNDYPYCIVIIRYIAFKSNHESNIIA